MGHKRPKFIRSDTNRFSRLGKNRRKLHKWRRVRGKSNKLRLGRGGYSKVPAVGFKSPRIESGKINGFVPKLVHNLAELNSLGKNEAAIIARIGARKKIELIKKADELKIKILNLGRNK